MSPACTGAWIETMPYAKLQSNIRSPACTGAWIETGISLLMCGASARRPLVRGRGLKQNKANKIRAKVCRPLVRGRGLKQAALL